MLPVELYVEAEAELADAIAFYEEREAGLGTRFREAAEAAIDALQRRPLSYPVVAGSDVRQALTSRFPYLLIFRVESEKTVVISVFHTSRNPVVWRGRIG